MRLFRLELCRFARWHTTLKNTMNMLIREVTLLLSLDPTNAVAVFTLIPFSRACKTTNTHRANRQNTVWTAVGGIDLWAKRSDTSEKESPVASQPFIAGSYFPVCPTMSGGAKLHITNGYWPLFTALQTLKQKLILRERTKLETCYRDNSLCMIQQAANTAVFPREKWGETAVFAGYVFIGISCFKEILSREQRSFTATRWRCEVGRAKSFYVSHTRISTYLLSPISYFWRITPLYSCES